MAFRFPRSLVILVEPLLPEKGMVSLNTQIGLSLSQRRTRKSNSKSQGRCRRSHEKILIVNLGVIQIVFFYFFRLFLQVYHLCLFMCVLLCQISVYSPEQMPLFVSFCQHLVLDPFFANLMFCQHVIRQSLSPASFLSLSIKRCRTINRLFCTFLLKKCIVNILKDQRDFYFYATILQEIKTALGWSLLGNITSKNDINDANSNLSINRLDITSRYQMLHQFVKNLWETEDYLSTNSREIAMSQENSV